MAEDKAFKSKMVIYGKIFLRNPSFFERGVFGCFVEFSLTVSGVYVIIILM